MYDLTIRALLQGYRARRFTPVEIMCHVLERIDGSPARNVWISRVAADAVLRRAGELLDEDREALPLYGIPFAIKDNIDLDDVPTTAACRAFSYVPRQSAHVVQKLIDAGAIPIGKTNMDQFATGLVGTRSPYGACENAFDPAYISGGSSSGSAVAVAHGLVSFALGTDTAGSGRIPAGFNNIIGLKPSCGRLSTRGVVPACRSLDCVSIFALTSWDAAQVLRASDGFDEEDDYARDPSRLPLPVLTPAGREVRIGVPNATQRAFFGDDNYAACYARAIERVRALGWRVVEIDFDPFREAAQLLYDGPWLAERYVAVGAFLREQADAMHPVTRAVIERGASLTAADAFAAQYRLKGLERRSDAVWQHVDALMVPTAGTIYTIAQVESDPIALNTNLGFYTNFVNLLDLAAVAAPAGFRDDGLPFGVTLVAPAGSESTLLSYADRLHRASVTQLGATAFAFHEPALEPDSPPGYVGLVVCGAHMRGLPLNHQLTDRRGFFVRSARTANTYRFYALSGGPPQRPGLVRVSEGGEAIDVEVWAVPERHFGSFVAAIPEPLGIGKVELEDGTRLSGFLCEAAALEGAEDISSLRSWRAFLERRRD
ncbi:MAG: allophanate hydrolase [Xanthomonadaceae bacterium]|nr:allophanate hydrolase [Xanthomonadaceae bacterium]